MLADRIRDARAQRRAVRIVGGGHWLDAGRPVTAPDTLSVAGDRGIVEYVPGDLTLTARAGTPVSELYAATKEHGQWLPLDPWGGDRGSIGATIATGPTGVNHADLLLLHSAWREPGSRGRSPLTTTNR